MNALKPKNHIKMDNKIAAKGLTEVPFDLFCPKVFEKVASRSCPTYEIYFPSKKAMVQHKKIHVPGGIRISRANKLDKSDIEDEEDEINATKEVGTPFDRMPIINNIFQFQECLWEEEIELQTMNDEE